LREIIGEIQVVTTPSEIRLETQKGAVEGAFLRAAGSQQINLVAGAGFELVNGRLGSNSAIEQSAG